MSQLDSSCICDKILKEGSLMRPFLFFYGYSNNLGVSFLGGDFGGQL